MSSTNSLIEKIQERLLLDFPKTAEKIRLGQVRADWDHLISPFEVTISKVAATKIKSGIHAIHKLSRTDKYQAEVPQPELRRLKNESVLMSYDFHSDQHGNVGLIEINTNASGLLISALGEAAKTATSIHHENGLMPKVKDWFTSEMALNERAIEKPYVAIVDEDIPNQKMQVEFHLYQELFESWGWSAEICESKDLKWDESTQTLSSAAGKKIDFVYNRLTDFLLESPHHQGLKAAWLCQSITLSPQPKEYLLLADKNRLLTLQNPEALKAIGASEAEIAAIQAISLPAVEIKMFTDIEQLWKDRKNWFFKPKNSFGGKSVYRGESVSRKVFDRLTAEDGLAQRFFPAQRLEGPWKFDLRGFTYRDQLYSLSARVYQGQVTNFSTPSSGFSTITTCS